MIQDMSLSDALNMQTKIIEAFKTRECNLIAIEYDTNEVNLDLYKQLSPIVRYSQDKKIIFFTKDSNQFVKNFKTEFQSNRVYKEISCLNFDLNDLTEKSQRKVLEKNIKVQGKQVKLKEVM